MSDLILPPGFAGWGPRGESELPAGRGTIVNETELPDHVVELAVETYFEENASMFGSQPNTFQTYAQQGGSILARSKFRTPANVYEEICLARDLAERDDDVSATIGAMVALAFGDGYQHTHEDEVIVALFDEMGKKGRIALAFKEMYREFLIAAQFTTVTAFMRDSVQFRPHGAPRLRSRSVVLPRVSVVPSEQVVPVGDDSFGTAPLYYRPRSAAQEAWLHEFFSSSTSPARKSEMRKQNPLLAALMMEEINDPNYGTAYPTMLDEPTPASGMFLYKLNPLMAHRTTMPKGAWHHPRPMLTRNFPLLEAKRLLNVMDYALLEGGSNFLVVAKKGSDLKPALPQEIEALRDTLRRASRSGVMIGDHRLNIEIITPDLTALLNPEKRKMIGRKLSMALLRIPDFQGDRTAGQGVMADVEILCRVVTSDRADIKLHVEGEVYEQTAVRNNSVDQGPPDLWFPKIILQGAEFFTDLLLKLRDRGDIPRKFVVESAGFDYSHAVAQRRLEKANGDDKVLTPAAIPFQGQAGLGGPQDNNAGRPRGASSDNGAPGAKTRSPAPAGAGAPKGTIARNAGETVTAMEEDGVDFRAGELTYAAMESYSDTQDIGRVSANERAALDRIAGGDHDTFTEGPLIVVPVNTGEELGAVRAVRLAPGLSLLVGQRPDDDAHMARALVFRSTEFSARQAEEMAVSFGFGPPAPPDTALLPVLDADRNVIGYARVELPA